MTPSVAVGVARRTGGQRPHLQSRRGGARRVRMPGRYWTLRYSEADSDALVARVQTLHRALRERQAHAAAGSQVPGEPDAWTMWFAAADASYRRFHGGRAGTDTEDAAFDALFGCGRPPADVAGPAWPRVAARVERVMEGYVLAAAAESGLLSSERVPWWVPALAGVLAACRQRWSPEVPLRTLLGRPGRMGPGLVQLCWRQGCTWPVAVSRRWGGLLAAGLALPAPRLLVTSVWHRRSRLDGIVVWRASGLRWPPGSPPRAWLGFVAQHADGTVSAGRHQVEAVRRVRRALWGR